MSLIKISKTSFIKACFVVVVFIFSVTFLGTKHAHASDNIWVTNGSEQIGTFPDPGFYGYANHSYRIDTTATDTATVTATSSAFVGSSSGTLDITTGWTQLINTNFDDASVKVPFGFNVPFNGTNYDGVYVESNTYFTFGAGSTQFSSLSPSSPAIPGVHLCSGDHSYQKIFYKLDSPGVIRVRYEGNNTTSGTVGEPGVVYEAVFYSGRSYVDVYIGKNIGCEAPQIGTPTISGLNIKDVTLIGDQGSWFEGAILSLNWQISSNGSNGWANIANATDTNYTIVSSDVGKYVRLAVTADNGSTTVTVYSDATSQIVASGPINFYESNDTAVSPSEPGSEGDQDYYHRFLNVDNDYLITALSHVEGGYDTQTYHFGAEIGSLSHPKFNVSWTGHGDEPSDKKVHLSIWNFLNSTWDEITSRNCGSDCTITGDKTGPEYHNNDDVWIKATADKHISPIVISDVSDHNRLLPITWSTNMDSDSEIVYDTVSHPGNGADVWEDYASHSNNGDMVSSHQMSPSLGDNNYNQWESVAASADGSRLIAGTNGGDIYTSSDSGATWSTSTSPGQKSWYNVDSSADGSVLIAAPNNGGDYIYFSTTTGAMWATSSLGTANWVSAAVSASGTMMVAGAWDNATLKYSADSGATWDELASTTGYWQYLSLSADGKKLIASDWGAGVYIGTYDSEGHSWTLSQPASTTPDSPYLRVVRISSDGTKMSALDNGCGGGKVYYSSDSGDTWSNTDAPTNCWLSMDMSSDGTKLVIGQDGGYIFTASYTGDVWNWTERVLSSSLYWTALAGSDNLSKLVGVVNNGDIHTSIDGGINWINRTGTTWYYRVRSTGADGQATTSAEYSMVFTGESSCPFIFTYDGSKYNFIIDASSAATLGSGLDKDIWDTTPFYKADAYPNPLSYVKFPHGFLASRTVDGETFYDIKTTFELNEINYYDQAALQVIDHDPSVTVYPDYRNTGTIHTISKTAPAPVWVKDRNGVDITNQVALNDDVYWQSDDTVPSEFLNIKLLDASTTPANLKLVIKRGKEGIFTGSKGSDKIQYKNSSGVFVDLPANKNPFTSTRAGAPKSSRNLANTYGVDTKVIDLSGLNIKDNEIRFYMTNNKTKWDIDWLAVDTTADASTTVTTLSPYYADLHFRGVSKQVPTVPGDSRIDITQPKYDELDKTVGGGNPIHGNATRYGDVTELLSTVDNKFVIPVQGDELALRYEVPTQATGTERDFIYKSWDYHKSWHTPTADTIEPLPFNEMTRYPYKTNEENYPYTLNQSYIDKYQTRVIDWGTAQASSTATSTPHHSLNTDKISLTVSEGTVVAEATRRHGGGSASSRISNLIAQGQTQAAQDLANQFTNGVIPSPDQNNHGGNGGASSRKFSRNLGGGARGADVQSLQKYLNDHGFPVATTGPGSPGNETDKFGKMTRAALIKFQKAHGIKPAVGYLGPITRAFIVAGGQ